MPSERAQTLIGLVKRNPWFVGVEVGVWQGDTSFALLDAQPNLKMFAVDHWTAQPAVIKNKDTGEATYSNQEALDNAKAQVIRRAIAYFGRLQIITANSIDGATQFKYRTVDFVFLDADHKTESVIHDYAAWEPIVREGGAILGHDANWGSVRRALDHIGEEYTLHPGNVWMIAKGGRR